MSRRRNRRHRGQRINPWVWIGPGIAVVALLLIIIFCNVVAPGLEDGNCKNGREPDLERPGYCQTTDEDFDELVIVTGNTQNSLAPDLDFEDNNSLNNLLEGVFYNTDDYGTVDIKIVSVAGENRTIDFDNSDFKVTQTVGTSQTNLKNLATEINKAIVQPPTESGADYLGAILQAQRLISPEAKNPLIMVVGSGLSDSGPMDFANNDLFGKYNKLHGAGIEGVLAENHGFEEGELAGTTIYWYNLGEVMDPQPSIKNYQSDFKKIYQVAFEYLGAEADLNKGNSGKNTNATAVESIYTVQPVFVDELKVGNTFDVNENIGKFYPDQATLVSENEMEQKLANFAAHFNPNNSTKLKLTGYLAFCGDFGTLSVDRANKIKEILIKLGIPENKIETHGESGPPPVTGGQAHSCENESNLPEAERRTVRIEVIEE